MTLLARVVTLSFAATLSVCLVVLGLAIPFPACVVAGVVGLVAVLAAWIGD